MPLSCAIIPLPGVITPTPLKACVCDYIYFSVVFITIDLFTFIVGCEEMALE